MLHRSAARAKMHGGAPRLRCAGTDASDPPQRSRLPGIAHALFCVGIPFQTRNAKTVVAFF
jgi:hypothetical protein